jgi:hypothetical protein
MPDGMQASGGYIQFLRCFQEVSGKLDVFTTVVCFSQFNDIDTTSAFVKGNCYLIKLYCFALEAILCTQQGERRHEKPTARCHD